ncbi:MAG: transposase [Proteobacteria bacterium]|nr:transposase [Pseudomonadota bacterium]
MAKNKKWSSAAKFEIALQAIKNDTPLNEICKKYEVSPSQVHAWKKQLLEEGMQLFNRADKTSKLIAEHEEKQRVLYETVGQLTVERDYLKKCWSKLRGSNDSD